MKKILITLLALFAIKCAKAQLNTYQSICYIEYKYDDAGNRISRMFECGANPYYQSNIDETDNNTQYGSNKAMQEKSINLSAIIFPNPTKGIFYVKLPNEMQECILEIKDIQGKLLSKEHITQLNTGIDISKFANGQYFINIITGNSLELLKLVKNDNE